MTKHFTLICSMVAMLVNRDSSNCPSRAPETAHTLQDEDAFSAHGQAMEQTPAASASADNNAKRLDLRTLVAIHPYSLRTNK